MQIRRVKPEVKVYTLGDGQGLSLLIEPDGSKSRWFRYRSAGKPKMTSPSVYPTITLADARSYRDDARKLVAEGKNSNEVRKEQKVALQTEPESTFKKAATERYQMESTRWSEGYAPDITEAFQNDTLPYVGERLVDEIKPLELLNALRRIGKRGALEKMRRAQRRCSETSCYVVATGRAEFNPAANLSSALEMYQSNHSPFLKADETPDSLRTLNGYTGSRFA